MRISFSMDGIRNMDQLYTKTTEYNPELGETHVEHYHGDDYCKSVINDVLNTLTHTDLMKQKYLGSCGRIANENFVLLSSDASVYEISFEVNTYKGEAARLEITIIAPEIESYDHRLEKLKIALKNRLLPDWYQCTWLADEQAAELCKNAYEKTFVIENNLRAFASKVLIHFLGVDWIKKAGLEKEAESVNALKEKFVKRVSDFDNINTDFLSMTLETLIGIMFKGVVYQDNIILNRQEYKNIQLMGTGKKATENNIAKYIKSLRTVDTQIWDNLFIPYIDDPDAFKIVAHDFIEDRNHVAHSKVLTWSAYQVILRDFEKMNSLILSADARFEHEETSDEVIQTWQVEHETDEYKRGYYRERLANETGMDILNEDKIKNWFDEVLHNLFDLVYQRYHFDICYEISDLVLPSESGIVFSISCPVVEDGSAKIDIISEYSIEDDLGEDSVCYIVAKDGAERDISKVEVRFHNGHGYEGEEGIMEVTDNTEYYTSELDNFQNDLFDAIESLNPYLKKLDALSYENKGAVQFVADFPCEQCGKLGVSIDESFLAVGRCCYCGYENELVKCVRCGKMVNAYLIENDLCPSCADYINSQ